MGVKMKKKIYTLLGVLWCMVIAGSRFLWLFFGERTITDTYEYFAHAMIQIGQGKAVASSGLESAYMKSLSFLLGFVGNKIEAVAAYQMVLQILWLVLVFIGISMIIGKVAGFVLSAILSALPGILNSIFIISPENFYLFIYSLILLGVAVIIFWVKKLFRHKKAEKAETVEMGEKVDEAKETIMEEKEENCVITEDGRQIQLLENPLPLPKKHVKKEIGFDINDLTDDFDVPVSDDDDFDF